MQNILFNALNFYGLSTKLVNYCFRCTDVINCTMIMNDIHLNSVLMYEYVTISSSETSTLLCSGCYHQYGRRDVEEILNSSA